ncbi:MAG: metallophosphoesterase [Candidatus Thorarchaeota archaeon]
MRFSIIGDLHGSISNLRQIIRKIQKTDALFITGDITGTISYYLVLKSILKSKKISRERYTELVYNQYLPQFIKFQVKSAKKIFNLLSKARIPVFFTHGNSDAKEVREAFEEYSENNSNFFYLGNSIIRYKDWIIVGYGFCSPAEYRTPFQTPGEKKKKEIEEDLKKLEIKIQEMLNDGEKFLFGIFHEPPKDSKLDYVARKLNHVGSELIKNHVSRIPYNFIFSGHVHESQNYEIQENTIFVNPGSLVNREWAIVYPDETSVSLKKILIPLSIKGLIYRSRDIFK